MTKKSSIDTQELNKFNKTSEEWWDEDGEFKILHKINPVRIEYIASKITNPQMHVLDVGCGGGLVSAPLCRLGAKVTALDANKYNIEAASTYAKKHSLPIKFIHTTIEDHVTSGKMLYDLVLSLEVIEHVAHPKEFIHNLTKLVKPEGIIILSTINRTIKSYIQAIMMAEYVLKWVPAGTHDYDKFIKPSELSRMLEGTGFSLQELKGLKFNPLNNSWYLSDDIDVNYFAVIAGYL